MKKADEKGSVQAKTIPSKQERPQDESQNSSTGREANPSPKEDQTRKRIMRGIAGI